MAYVLLQGRRSIRLEAQMSTSGLGFLWLCQAGGWAYVRALLDVCVNGCADRAR